MTNKPILCVTFDGVIHANTSGWLGSATINDQPIPGALNFLHRAVETFDVYIYCDRSNNPNGISAMQTWLRDADIDFMGYNGVPVPDTTIVDRLFWPATRPAAAVYIDASTVPFRGIYPSIDSLLVFRPWNQT